MKIRKVASRLEWSLGRDSTRSGAFGDKPAAGVQKICKIINFNSKVLNFLK